MRFHISSFKFFTTLVGVTFVGLFAIANYIRPLTRQDPGRFTEFRPDMRVPLMVSGVEDRPQAGDSIMPEINSNLTLVGLENVRNKLREVKQKAELEKKNLTELTSEANKTDEDDSAQVSNSQQKEDLAVPEVVSQKPTGEPPPVKDEENSGMRQRKISKKVKITFDNPDLYKGPFVEGWPPSKDRYMPHYIKPGEDTFPIRPSKDHFKGCNLLVIVHSSIDAFNDRMGVRDTWLQYVTEGRVENVSVIFLIGNQNAFQNVTDLTK